MSFRVQYTISDAEYQQIKAEAFDEGFPSPEEYAKSMALRGKRTYGQLFNKAIAKIKELPKGSEFVLNEIVDTPPALLGVWIVNSAKEGGQLFGSIEQIGVKPSRFVRL